jgi:threonine/homoserine/homoserine lactone efflux protein
LIGFLIGTALGSLTILTTVCYGMDLWLEDYPGILTNSKYLMLAYMIWIARDIWKGGFDMTGTDPSRKSSFALSLSAGFVTCLTSPFILILFPLILPQVLEITTSKMPDFLILTMTTLTIEITVVAVAVGLALQLRRMARSTTAMLIMNRGLAMLLGLSGNAKTLA